MDFGIVAGDTDQTIYVRLRDSTTGLAKTGLVFNSAGAACYYTLPGAAAVQIALATQTVNGAHSDGGFVLVSDTNAKGLYRLDLPDAAIASGKYSIISIEFDGIIEESVIVPLALRKSDVRQLAGVTQSLTDLKDFADDGYDPATNKVQGVVLVDTLTTYTGNTPQTADHTANIAAIVADTNELQTDWANGGRLDLIVDAILLDTAEIGAAGAGLTALATQASVNDVPTNAELATAIDAALASHHVVLVKTTIATLASQTSFTLTAGSADNSAYVGCEIVIEDSVTAAQKAVGVVSAYTGATKTATLLTDPAVFTMAVGDVVTIRPSRALKATVDNRTLDVTATGAAGIDWGNVENPTTAVNLSGTNIDVDQVVASVSGAVGSISGVTFPANFAALGINISGHVSRVVLVDTLTTYTGNTVQTGDSFARIGATGSGLASLAQASVATEARLAELDAANLPADVAARATPAQVNAEVLDVLNVDTLIDGKTIVAALKIDSAILAGKISGAGTGTEIFVGLDGVTTRVTVTVDTSGNRTAVVYA